ncbi:MAG TPA: methenyltetrahydrofolate cyclohydrolase [Candidatus Omnitrophica bacterium]|nr:methenyltetrahydrofolate cyclohydrolase [Candidatus Omnitrophota bacterium]
MTMEKYLSQSIKRYLDDLSARKPAPGGGSAGALAGALACGLVSMVANFSLGKGLKDEEKIGEILQESEDLRVQMSEFVDEDVKVYEKVSSVFRLPKDSEGRGKKIQEALKEAAKVPLEIARLSLRISQLNRELLPICNQRLISDIGVSVSLAYASCQVGAMNVRINLASIKDKEFNKRCEEKLDMYLKDCRKLKEEIYPEVERKISE